MIRYGAILLRGVVGQDIDVKLVPVDFRRRVPFLILNDRLDRARLFEFLCDPGKIIFLWSVQGRNAASKSLL